MNHERYAKNVPGDFYIENLCCASCGVICDEAPPLIRFDDTPESGHCYVYKQPSTPVEFEQMLNAIEVQDLGCIRYAGTDPKVLERFGKAKLWGNCDHLCETGDAQRLHEEERVRTAKSGSWLKRILAGLFGRRGGHL